MAAGAGGWESGSRGSWVFNSTSALFAMNNDRGTLSEKTFKDSNLKHASIFFFHVNCSFISTGSLYF